MAGRWPRVVGSLGPRMADLLPGFMGPHGDGRDLDPVKRWRVSECEAIEGSMRLCEGCNGLPECRQPADLNDGGGSGITGAVYVPAVHLGEVIRMVRFCKYERLRKQASEKPWMEKRHAEFTFKGYVVTDNNRPAFVACQRFVRDAANRLEMGRGLVLSGSTGVGKTHLASAIFSAVVKDLHVSASFVVVPKFLDELRNRYGDREGSLRTDTAAAYLAATSDAKLLVLDDLQLRNVTPWVIDAIKGIIDHRYRNLLSTIVTTGWTPEQMGEILEEQVPSRLVQQCEWYNIVEVDWRREQAKKVGGRKPSPKQ